MLVAAQLVALALAHDALQLPSGWVTLTNDAAAALAVALDDSSRALNAAARAAAAAPSGEAAASAAAAESDALVVVVELLALADDDASTTAAGAGAGVASAFRLRPPRSMRREPRADAGASGSAAPVAAAAGVAGVAVDDVSVAAGARLAGRAAALTAPGPATGTAAGAEEAAAAAATIARSAGRGTMRTLGAACEKRCAKVFVGSVVEIGKTGCRVKECLGHESSGSNNNNAKAPALPLPQKLTPPRDVGPIGANSTAPAPSSLAAAKSPPPPPPPSGSSVTWPALPRAPGGVMPPGAYDDVGSLMREGLAGGRDALAAARPTGE